MIGTHTENIRLEAERRIEQCFRSCKGPERLLTAIGYSLRAGGKRIRPVLLVATWHGLRTENAADPWPAACAIEFIHTYSLIHDDLPAMDDDDMRRGKPSCHKAFGEAMAILAGDGLLSEAFRLIADGYRTRPGMGLRVVAEVAGACGSAGMVGGQALDITEAGNRIPLESLRSLHLMKTGALLRASVRCGAILAGASEDKVEAAGRWAEKIGLAFQVADDLLDELAGGVELGKTPGKDRKQGKNTYVALMGVHGSRECFRSLLNEAVREVEQSVDETRPLLELADYLEKRVERYFA